MWRQLHKFHTLEWERSLHADYTQIFFSRTRLINEAPGGKSGLRAIVGLHHRRRRHLLSSFKDTPSHSSWPSFFSSTSAEQQGTVTTPKITAAAAAADVARCLQPSAKSHFSSFGQSHIAELVYQYETVSSVKTSLFFFSRKTILSLSMVLNAQRFAAPSAQIDKFTVNYCIGL